MSVGPCTEFAIPALPTLKHMRGSGCDDTKTPLRPGFKPCDFIIRQRAIVVALLVRHCGKHRAVSDRHTSSLKGVGFQGGVHIVGCGAIIFILSHHRPHELMSLRLDHAGVI